jgi:hypothetical protein
MNADSGALSEIDMLMKARQSDPSHAFKSELRSLFDDFKARVGRDPDERERQAIVFWLAGEWISIAAFACGRVDASFSSVAERVRSEFERGLRKMVDDGTARAVEQE